MSVCNGADCNMKNSLSQLFLVKVYLVLSKYDQELIMFSLS